MELSRRGFIKLTGAGLAASSLGALGFGFAGEALAASVRPFKLTATTETRNTCTYCSVACGILIYSLGDRAKNAGSDIIHIEGDPDHPVNRGTLCPKGSALLDIVHAPTRLKVPKYRAPGSSEFKRGLLGLRARPHRHADEAGSRRELHRQERRRDHGQPLAHAPACWRRPRPRTKRPTSPGRSPAPSAWWSSTIRRASDTDRRWPVWPQHSVAAR